MASSDIEYGGVHIYGFDNWNDKELCFNIHSTSWAKHILVIVVRADALLWNVAFYFVT